MDKAQELCDRIDRIKKQIEENADADGNCRFNEQHMEWILILAEKTLQDSIESFKME